MQFPRKIVLFAAALAALSFAGVPGAAADEGNAFVVHNLVSDVAGRADHVDANLVNAWGLAALPTSPWWVADNGTDVATIYQADGTKAPLTVQVPKAPTGEVANASSSFVVSSGSASGPARFIWATEEGKILGWNPSVVATQAVVAVDRSSVGAVFKGLAIATTTGGSFLFATDFHNAKVDVFDGSFHQVTTPGAFVDSRIPAGFAPFGIQNVGGRIFVTYAKQDAAKHDDVPGIGNGFVDAFDTSGKLLMRVASRGLLNSPWGLAPAPGSFGDAAGDLLVGNFGDGRINVFSAQHENRAEKHGKSSEHGRKHRARKRDDEQQPNGFEFRGQLRGQNDKPITIDGLWSLQFGLGAPANGPTDTLFFTAGPDGEMHGLFGTIRAAK